MFNDVKMKYIPTGKNFFGDIKYTLHNYQIIKTVKYIFLISNLIY